MAEPVVPQAPSTGVLDADAKIPATLRNLPLQPGESADYATVESGPSALVQTAHFVPSAAVRIARQIQAQTGNPAPKGYAQPPLRSDSFELQTAASSSRTTSLIPISIPVPTIPVSPVPSITTSKSSSLTTAVIPTRTIIPKPHSNTGAIAGGAVGCLLAGIIIGAVLIFVFRRRKAPARVSEPALEYDEAKKSDTISTPKIAAGAAEIDGKPISELP